jgi:hypothetical protein
MPVSCVTSAPFYIIPFRNTRNKDIGTPKEKAKKSAQNYPVFKEITSQYIKPKRQ